MKQQFKCCSVGTIQNYRWFQKQLLINGNSLYFSCCWKFIALGNENERFFFSRTHIVHSCQLFNQIYHILRRMKHTKRARNVKRKNTNEIECIKSETQNITLNGLYAVLYVTHNDCFFFAVQSKIASNVW